LFMSFYKGELKGRFDFLPQDRVIYGSDSIGQLQGEVRRLGARKALIITTPEIAATKVLERSRQVLGGLCAGTFTGVIPHVPRTMVIDAAMAARKAGADLLVTLGGGSCTDTGRATALAIAENIRNPADFDKHRADLLSGGSLPSITGKVPPQIAVPTTLSAAEYDAVAGITDTARKTKELYIDVQLVPKVVILDPDLTLTVPPRIWLSTGIKAIDHCVESMYSTNHHPFTDGLTYQALGMLFYGLPLSKKHPEDTAIRGQLLIASWLSMFGIGNVNLGLSHGIAHQLGARCNVPHGITSCVMLPAVMEFNRAATADRQALVAKAAGVDIAGMSSEEAATRASEAVLGLIRALDLPYRLRDVGVRREDFAALADDTLKDPIVKTNPTPVTSVVQVLGLLEKAW
jgi:alcohol dehydrogenase class IV